jgi:O-antigen/teichoic acid export membrane protein
VSGIRLNHMSINSIWAMVGNIFYAFTQWLTLIAVIQFGSIEMAGQYGYALALTAPIFLLFNLQLRGILATDYSQKSTINDYFTIRVVTSVIALIICVASAFFLDESVRLVVLMVAWCKMVESLSELLYGVLQKKERMKIIAISRIIKGVGSVLVLSVLLNKTDDLKIALLGVLVVWISVLMLYDLLTCGIEIKIKEVTWKSCKVIIRIGLPLGFVLMLISLIENIPRYFIEHHFDTAALGVFTAIAYFKVAGGTLVNAIGQSTAHQFSIYYIENKTVEFKLLLVRLLILVGCIGIVGVFLSVILGEWLLTFFYSASFEQYTLIFSIIMVAAFFSYIAALLGTIMTAVRIIKAQPLIFMFVCLVSIIASFYIIPVYGLTGASLVLLLNSISQLALNAVVTCRTLKKGAFI